MNSDKFKLGMRQLAGAVTIVTAGRGEEIAGLTATAVCSLSASPSRLLVCLNMQGLTFDILRRHSCFCVNVLSVDDLHIAETFAQLRPSASDNKFDEGDWCFSKERSPRLLSATVSFECQVHSVIMLATHGLVVGDVQEVHMSEPSRPLLYHEGTFASLGSVA